VQLFISLSITFSEFSVKDNFQTAITDLYQEIIFFYTYCLYFCVHVNFATLPISSEMYTHANSTWSTVSM